MCGSMGCGEAEVLDQLWYLKSMGYRPYAFKHERKDADEHRKPLARLLIEFVKEE